ncbi:hypothetical protein BKA62DRAFT_618075 [Auriculariales sp. MPI-PUGE-AT-0066]|nr:hypothetical protein BKA62DRAFT_618075 [Auriculariales sp. MPI-PUGE-AT-0066]
MIKCHFCRRPFKNSQGVSTHLAQDAVCRKRLQKCRRLVADRVAEEHHRANDSDSDESQHSNDGFQHLRSPRDESYFDITYNPSPSPDRTQLAMVASVNSSQPKPPPTSSARRPTVADELEDDGTEDFVDIDFTAAAESKKRQRVPFSSDYENMVTKDRPRGPFPTVADWEIAEWSTIESVSDAAVSRLLTIQSARSDNLKAKSTRDLHSYIDKLPNSAEFQHKELHIEGQNTPFDCFYRNALDLVRDLLGDPTYEDQLLFQPVRRYTSRSKKSRKYSEWNTGEWAWEIQAKLPCGATTIPIILATDKTELTSFTGKQTCYPVYMTIGNIPKHLRRQPSMRSWRLLAYLPTGKVDGTIFSANTARKLRAQLFHRCMTLVCKPLFEPANKGEVFIDSHGVARTCYTILVAYAADYPEQCLIACVRYGQACPICDTLLADFDKDEPGDLRSQEDTIATIDFARQQSAQESNATLKAAGLTNVPEPFWKMWPHANIHAAMSSDVLHQLVQGMGKHLVSWLIELVDDEDELDARFQRIPYATGLRRFRDGISTLSNVSGTEHKAIYAQLLGCIHGIVPDDAVRAACALLDFIYVAQYECHSDDTLTSLSTALSDFHEYKKVFKEHNIRSDFNLPKLHACQHYVQCIRRLGTVDNYNTECTERLHIDLAKHAYAATNKRDYEIQMCRWLQRREAVLRFRTFLDWKADKLVRPPRHAAPPAHPILLRKKPHRQHYKLADLKKDLGEVKISEPLEDFLRRWHKSPTWRGYTTVLPPLVSSALARLSYVSLWYHVKFVTPNTETLASKNSRSTAYASPVRGQYDPVLVRLLGEDVAGCGGINGTSSFTTTTFFLLILLDLRVGRLRAIFKIPELFSDDLFGVTQPDHLALVELYLPLGRREDTVNGMYNVQKPPHSIAVVVEVNSLRRAAHLFPKFGAQRVDRKLTSLTVLNKYTDFYLNNRVDKDAYRNTYWDVGEDDDDEDEAAPASSHSRSCNHL